MRAQARAEGVGPGIILRGIHNGIRRREFEDGGGEGGGVRVAQEGG